MSEPMPGVTTDSSAEQVNPTPATVRGLIVFVRGLHRWSPNEYDYSGIENLLRKRIFGYELYRFLYRGTYWSSEDPEDLAVRLEREITEEVLRERYTELYLVGHSFGALLLRQAILYNADSGRRTHHWLPTVKKVVLLAGTNRGFHPYNRLVEHMAVLGRLFQRVPLSSSLKLGRLAVSGLRGSEWVTRLRMDWIAKSAKKSEDDRPVLPFTVQIRGTQDKLVGPNDSRDISVAHNSLDLPVTTATHRDLALLNPQKKDSDLEDLLDKAIETAVKAEPQKAVSENVEKQKSDSPATPNHVVFLIHGIRDFAEWHEDLGETITQIAGKPNRVQIVPISYGYFSALQFLFPTARGRCGRTFLDSYVQWFARYPSAKFSALAHSNGTFALTWAMRQNPLIADPRGFGWQRPTPQLQLGKASESSGACPERLR